MGVGLTVHVEGAEEIERFLKRVHPKKHPRITSGAFEEFARDRLIPSIKLKQIKAGGGRKRGANDSPLDNMLTSRTGELRRSIQLSWFRRPGILDVGTDLAYGAVHEKGGKVTIGAHSRTSKLGNTFSVGSYVARYRKRSFLQPALDDEWPSMARILLEHVRRAGGGGFE